MIILLCFVKIFCFSFHFSLHICALFIGGSSGAAMACAVEVAKTLNEDQVCVVICPDNIRNYMTKFIVDNWMEARGLRHPENVYNHASWNEKISDVIDKTMRSRQTWMPMNSTIQDVVEKLESLDVDQIPVLDDNGCLQGVATTSCLMNKMLDLSANLTDVIARNLFKKFVKLHGNSSLGLLSRVLEKEIFVVVQLDDVENETEDGLISWIATKFTMTPPAQPVVNKFFIVTQRDLLKILTGYAKNSN